MRVSYWHMHLHHQSSGADMFLCYQVLIFWSCTVNTNFGPLVLLTYMPPEDTVTTRAGVSLVAPETRAGSINSVRM